MSVGKSSLVSAALKSISLQLFVFTIFFFRKNHAGKFVPFKQIEPGNSNNNLFLLSTSISKLYMFSNLRPVAMCMEKK